MSDVTKRRKPRYSAKTKKKVAGIFADVVRKAAKVARTQQVEQTQLESLLSALTGATPAERNAQRLDAILRRALPATAPGALQRILDRTLDTLYCECSLDANAVRALLAERRDPHRSETTPLDARAAVALAYLSEIVTACEEPVDREAARELGDAGLSADALLNGRAAARARRNGGQTRGGQRQVEASPDHAKWCAQARKLLEHGRNAHEVASIVAAKSGVNVRTVRNALQRAGVLVPRKREVT
jgi:hypothetical protein